MDQSPVNKRSSADSDRVIFELSTGSIVKFFAILTGIYVLFLLRDIVLIVLTAIVFASAIEPIVLWFKRHYVERIYGVIIIYLSAAILTFGLIYFFIPNLIAQFRDVTLQFPAIVSSIQDTNFSDSNGVLGLLDSAISLDSVFGSIQSTSAEIFSSPAGVLKAVFGGFVSFILIIVLSFYFSVQEDGVANFLKIITPRTHESYVIGLWQRTRKKIGAWLQGQLILSVVVGTFSYVALTIAGVPNALFLALLAGMFELIPIFGPILASIPAIIVGFLSGGIQLGLIVAVIYFGIQQLENHVFHPVVVKKVVGVPAIVVVIAMLVGAKLAGFLGIILAVPIAAGFMELLGDIEKYKIAQSGRGFGVLSELAEADNVEQDNQEGK